MPSVWHLAQWALMSGAMSCAKSIGLLAGWLISRSDPGGDERTDQ